MVLDIQSKEVIDKISDELKVQPSLLIPRELAKVIQLVYNVNPSNHVNIVRTAVVNNTTTTLFTVPAKKHFFLTGYSNAASGNAVRNLSIIINGETIILNKSKAGTGSDAVPFIPPIKVDDGSVISATCGAVVDSFPTIVGYTTDIQ